MKPGKFEGTLKDCGMNTTKSGDPQIVLLFNLNVDGNTEEIAWYGSLKEGKARDITLKALLTCGFKGNNVEEIAEGTNCFEMGVPVSCTIEEQEYNGKKSLRVAWINTPGTGLLDEKITKAEAVQKIKGMNLAGSLAQLRQKQGEKKTEGVPW